MSDAGEEEPKLDEEKPLTRKRKLCYCCAASWGLVLLGFVGFFIYIFTFEPDPERYTFPTFEPEIVSNGFLSVCAYNVAGLPAIISSAETPRRKAHVTMGRRISDFDIVHVQEDFAYHDQLLSENRHEYQSPTTGIVTVGNGLNFFSHHVYVDVDPERQIWNRCDGFEECVGMKGFDLKRVRLAMGVYVDVYNIHAGAKSTERAVSFRRSQMEDFLSYVEKASAGNTIIIFGDLNSRWTRVGDAMYNFLDAGFTDIWVELVRDGNYSSPGDEALVCDLPKQTAPDCEVVDKVLIRNNRFVNLEPTLYELRNDFLYSDGNQLSDHEPIVVDFNWTTPDGFYASDMVNVKKMSNNHYSFNDFDALLDAEATRIESIALRENQLVLNYDSNISVSHPLQNNGVESVLELEEGEGIQSLAVCSRGDQISHIAMQTSLNNTIATEAVNPRNCDIINAEQGYQLFSLYGRQTDTALSTLGFIFREL